MEQIKYELTAERKKELEQELRHLIDVKRPEIIEQIKAAREQGDLTENAEYEAARVEQGKVETRIKDIQEYLDRAVLIRGLAHNAHNKKIKLGAKFTIKDLSDKNDYSYQVVGEIETDPANGKISNDSPLYIALQNKGVGDEVEVRGVEVPYKVRVLDVE